MKKKRKSRCEVYIVRMYAHVVYSPSPPSRDGKESSSEGSGASGAERSGAEWSEAAPFVLAFALSKYDVLYLLRIHKLTRLDRWRSEMCVVYVVYVVPACAP